MGSSRLCPSKEKEIRNLDENIWAEILGRLPVKVIGRIRCVCKSWNSLISSSFFVKHHLSLINFTASSSSNYSDYNKPSYLLFDPCIWSRTVHSCFYNPDEEEPHLARFSPVPFETPVGVGVGVDDDGVVMYSAIGVINGVVCVSREPSWPRTAGSAILWNPTIRKYATTPDDQRHDGWLVVGFGFDARTNDFKVVRFMPSYDPFDGPPTRFEVFSTRGGSSGWRSVAADHIGPFLLRTKVRCYKNGSIHWVVGRRGDVNEVLAFDCELEEFRIMELPQQVRRSWIEKLFVRDYNCCRDGGMLSALVAGEGPGVEVWVMEEYGVSASWKKLKPDDHPPTEDFVSVHEGGAVLHLRQGLLTHNKLEWKRIYDRIAGLHQPLNGYVFQPSLFLMETR